MKFDLYQEITNQIVAMLEQGVVPWRSLILGPGSPGQPVNLHSGKPYRGVNVFLLAFTAWAKDYASPYWLTYRQAAERKGSVRKGEKSTMVVFWKTHEVEDEETGMLKTLPVLRYYSVFNAEQCHGIDLPDAVAHTPTDFNPIEAADAIVTGYAGGPAIQHGGTEAFYLPADDTVRLPEATRFASNEAYYATLYHELAHSTGHGKRLNRSLATQTQPYGSREYGKEELVAETAAAFLCAQAGIAPATIENQAAYIQGWLRMIRADKRLVIHAAGAGQ